MDFQKELNRLVDIGAICRVDGCGGTSKILRYKPLVQHVNSGNHFVEHPEACYVFEIGENCGTVFSARCVKEIIMTSSEYIIYLKGK